MAHRLGDPFDYIDRPDSFELEIDDYLWVFEPAQYGLNLPPIDPKRYFVTSGDGICKIEHLEKDYFKLIDVITQEVEQKQLSTDELIRRQNCLQATLALAGRARWLWYKMTLARGPYLFFETEWNNNKLICIPKNPRSVGASK
jgi:hypothetical protein